MLSWWLAKNTMQLGKEWVVKICELEVTDFRANKKKDGEIIQLEGSFICCKFFSSENFF